MTSNNQAEQKPLFPTPNPTELKEQAKQDPIQEKYPDPDTINDDHSENEMSHSEESYFEKEENRALSSSPIINANISAG